MKTRTIMSTAAVVMIATIAVLVVYAQQQPKNDKANNMEDIATEEMNKRGDHVMGFDHTKTTHHFRLFANGGSIEITANTVSDTESREQIQMHLGHIARMFADVNFKAPM